MTPARQYRCRLCGEDLPAWLPVAKRPDTPMLLHHVGRRHRAEAGAYLRRMETETIAAVLLEVYKLAEKEG